MTLPTKHRDVWRSTDWFKPEGEDQATVPMPENEHQEDGTKNEDWFQSCPQSPST